MPQVRYVVRVNDLEEHHYEHVFSYPAPDCFVNRAPTLEEETDLAVELNKAHCQQILAARPFQCVGCGGKPEKLMEAPHLFLKDPADLVVVSYPVPMCHDRQCAVACTQLVQQQLHMINEETGWHFISKCLVCGKTEQIRTCGRCKAARYCSAGCQRLDWPYHKKACKAYANQDPVGNYFARKHQSRPLDCGNS